MDQDGTNGKDPIDPYSVTVDYRGDIPQFSFAEDLSSPEFLKQYQASSEGENSEASLKVLRADADYYIGGSDGWLESLDFGARYGVRDAEHAKFYYVAPTARYSNYDDQRVAEDLRFRLRRGNEIWQKYPEWRRFDIADEDQRLVTIGGLQDNNFGLNNSMPFTDFGPIGGFEGGVSALNPAAWDNPLAFMNRLYPGTQTAEEPGDSYVVKEAATSAYAQLNFDRPQGVSFLGVAFSGNFGVHVVRTERQVERNVIPEVLNKFNSIGYDDWQRIAFVADSETVSHSYTDVLPSLNVNFYPADDVVMRLGAASTMTRNDLSHVGSGLVLWYQRCPKTEEEGRLVTELGADGKEVAEEVSCVGGGSDRGDPAIKPWRANVFNTSTEWYFADNAILGAGLFLIDIESSVENFQEQRSFVDGDGVDRGRTANVWVADNASASELYGLELGYKQPFTFLPGDYHSATGIEFNYTFSQSASKDFDINGQAFPLPSSSRHQSNMILWYDRKGLSARLAYNWRSKEYIGRAGLNTNAAVLELGSWQKPSAYLDLSVNYWVNEHLSVYFNGTNLTEQHQATYAQFEQQFRSLSIQERRFSLGVTLSL